MLAERIIFLPWRQRLRCRYLYCADALQKIVVISGKVVLVFQVYFIE